MRGCEKPARLEDWQQLRTQIFWCYDGVPPVAAGRAPFRTPNHSAWLIRRGHVVLYWEGRAQKISPGSWVLVPPPGHERDFSEDAEILSIHFRLTWAEDTDLFTLPGPVTFPGQRHPALERVVGRMSRFFERFDHRNRLYPVARMLTLPEYLHFQTLAGRFALTLTDALDDEQALPAACCERPHPQLSSILAQLRGLPLDRPWSTADNAGELGMSLGHFNRVFRQEYGQTPREYFDTRRLEQAKHGVLAGQVSLKEVAASVGFSSAVFCRWFRQAVGVSPTRYRQIVGVPRRVAAQ